MKKFSLFFLAFLIIAFGVQCSSDGNYDTRMEEDYCESEDLVKAKLHDIKEFFVSLESQKPATFPSQEISIYSEKFDRCSFQFYISWET